MPTSTTNNRKGQFLFFLFALAFAIALGMALEGSGDTFAHLIGAGMFGGMAFRFRQAVFTGGASMSATNHIEQFSDSDALDAVLSGTTLVFKHSTQCPVSFAAHSQVRAFSERHDHIPVTQVNVIEQRAVSNAVANTLGVIHQSPQVIWVEDGEVRGWLNHHQIREETLEELTGASRSYSESSLSSGQQE